QFKEKIDPIRLPFYQAEREPRNGSNEEQVVFRLDKNVSEALAAIAKEENGTMFTILATILALLIEKYTHQDNIILGTPVSNRKHLSLEDQIGLYLSTLPLKIEVRSTEYFNEMVRRSSRSVLEALGHQAYPFDKLVNDLRLAGVLGSKPIFNVMINMVGNDYFEKKQDHMPVQEKIDITVFPVPYHYSKYDLIMYCSLNDGILDISLEYNTDHFSEADIIQFGNSYQALIRNIIINPNQRISYYSIFDKPDFSIASALTPTK
ncbi:condensation domain-containing protein, partial [Mucilaginibacter sp. RCC_168]|uniref:condensation domain-containing protein n=1 Tax=Mucilaginibacter sp. RCC_168 TaxID=3239221 RepID=UPI003525D627